jgi:hypothetical protein
MGATLPAGDPVTRWGVGGALLAAVLVAVVVGVAPRWGGIVLAIIVFRMLSTGVEKGNI